ncbi:MAG: 3-dehydroquinate synthase, partial [Bacteroidetes bacterium]|nr:3-dehydroquinate synthase [Bacteroidota bacterium]
MDHRVRRRVPTGRFRSPAIHASCSVSPILVQRGDGGSYPLRFAPLRSVPSLLEETQLRPGRCFIVTDEHVAAHHLEPLMTALRAADWQPRAHVIAPGEASKSHAVLTDLYDDALGWGIDRKTPVLALGGGVVGDLAGFAAATLLRGVPVVQIPTSLIAQVDSAIGGKTGINHEVGKNLIGAFYPPRLVVVDLTTLNTLPQREWTSGLAEVVKHALIADADFFELLEHSWDQLLRREPDVVASVVHRAAAIKAEVVSQDEHERGLRMILNFGHTFGHAIEREAGYGRFTHGEAVALGMRAALTASRRLHPSLPYDRLDALVARLPVPYPLEVPTEALIAAMQTDKKVSAGTVRLVLLRALGDA